MKDRMINFCADLNNLCADGMKIVGPKHHDKLERLFLKVLYYVTSHEER